MNPLIKKKKPYKVVLKLPKNVCLKFINYFSLNFQYLIWICFLKFFIAPKENDLFGEADDISSDEDQPKTPRPTSDNEVDRAKSDNDDKKSDDDDKKSDDDDDKKSDDEENITKDDYEKEKDVDDPIPERRIAVEIPKISVDLGSDLHFVKLPNFLSVETRPYDRDTYEDEIDEEETLDEEGRARFVGKH